MTEYDDLPWSAASERNREPIGDVLTYWLPRGGRVLEIGAGTGQHAVHFHRIRPDLEWLATDVGHVLEPLARRLSLEAPALAPPRALTVGLDTWPPGPFDAVYTANTLHIMPWSRTPALLDGAATCLRPDGCLVVYGPFRDGGRHSAASNAAFDHSLRSRDPEMGVRDAISLTDLAAERGLVAEADLTMPANNRILIFCKQGGTPHD
ncbi:MAG: DUF938 domain-containing protein [Pseudomonadota bacterium]|nr:MAG: DUF938 domain-containing protein [Pseudomonadota bacterium]